jgi:hypothetical protein
MFYVREAIRNGISSLVICGFSEERPLSELKDIINSIVVLPNSEKAQEVAIFGQKITELLRAFPQKSCGCYIYASVNPQGRVLTVRFVGYASSEEDHEPAMPISFLEIMFKSAEDIIKEIKREFGLK